MSSRVSPCRALVLPSASVSHIESPVSLRFWVLALFLGSFLIAGESVAILEASTALMAIPSTIALVVKEWAYPRWCLVKALGANLPAFVWPVSLDGNTGSFVVLKSHPQPRIGSLLP